MPAGEPRARHVGVVGAGIIGVATALELARRGVTVTLVDREDPGRGASYGNGGVLAAVGAVPVTVPGLVAKIPGMVLSRETPLFLRWPYLPRLLPWLARYLSHCRAAETSRITFAMGRLTKDALGAHRRLAAGTAATQYVHACEYLYVYRDREAFRREQFSWDLRRELGYRWTELDAEALKSYDPLFGGTLTGFAARIPGHGRISDPYRYVLALADGFRSAGGVLRRAEVRDIEVSSGKVTALTTSEGRIACDTAVLATGAWSLRLIDKFGLRIPLESERGYHIMLVDPERQLQAPVMFAEGKFVATPMDRGIRCAGLAEFGGLAAGPQEAPLTFLRRQIDRLLPGIKAKGREEWLGHRPTPADSLPVIGAVPGVAGLYLAFGHHHLGLTTGAITGRRLAEAILDRPAALDLHPFRPGRFARSLRKFQPSSTRSPDIEH